MNKAAILGAISAFAACGVCAAVSAFAQEANDPCLGTADKADLEKVHPTRPPYSPYAGRNFPTRPLFGDTHLHTGYSMDAGAFGAKLGPRDAYRFARGEKGMSNTNQPVKLSVGRSTFWSWPTTPTEWVSSRSC